jgi:hypothetical protein
MVYRDWSPRQRRKPIVFEDPVSDFTTACGVVFLLRKKEHPNGEIRFGSLSKFLYFSEEESGGQLNEQPGPVTGATIGVDCASVSEIAERFKRVLNYVVAWVAGDISDEPNSARVMFVVRII